MKRRDNLKFHLFRFGAANIDVALTLCVAVLVLGISNVANAAHDASDVGHRSALLYH